MYQYVKSIALGRPIPGCCVRCVLANGMVLEGAFWAIPLHLGCQVMGGILAVLWAVMFYIGVEAGWVGVAD